ncbi:hypothetical protein ABPG77_003546 [Micractinium sp. CCAP 211/92]
MIHEQQRADQPPLQPAVEEPLQAEPAAGSGLGLAGSGGVAVAAGAASSNYDFVKIKVRLGTQLEHYYILSRFLLSRMLTVITLPQHKAVRIALDVKRHLVDHGRLDITQEELEEALFAALRQRGYGDDYVRRYQMVTRFFQQKRPLIILVAGSACTGKSSLAQQLASRLNLPNVLQTDVLYELLRASGMGDLPAEPLWRRPLPAGTSAVAAFQQECATIRQALDGELCKCIRDGKSIIIEGLHLDPGLFLSEFGDPRGAAAASAAPAEPAAGAGPLPPDDPGTGSAAARSRAEAESASAAVGQRLSELQLTTSSDAAPSLPPISEGVVLLNGTAAAVAPAEPAGNRGQGADAPQCFNHHQQQQQGATGTAAGSAGALTGVRRTASFGDAVSQLSYGALHRQQSPWRDVGSGKPLLRPCSARMSDQLGQRGQAVVMLQSTDAGEAAAPNGGPAPPSALPPPVPSPRLSACLSLPIVQEHLPERRRQPRQRSSSSPCTLLPSPLQPPVGSVRPEQAAAVPASPEAVPPLKLDSSEHEWHDQQQQQLGQAHVGGLSAPAGSPGVPQMTAGQHEARTHVPAWPSGVAAELQHGRPVQHSSMAAADAAAAAAAGTGPVFVPICLAVPDGEYEGMLQDWVQRQERAYASSASGSGNSSTGAGSGRVLDLQGVGEAGCISSNGFPSPPTAGGSVPTSEGAARLQAVQAHLRQYGSRGVPVVELNMSDMGAALDAMHAYVLQCIALATGEHDYQ